MNVSTRLNLTPAPMASANALAQAAEAPPSPSVPEESSALSRAVRSGMRKASRGETRPPPPWVGQPAWPSRPWPGTG